MTFFKNLNKLTLKSFLIFIVLGVTGNSQKLPNILFVISDDQSFAHTSYAGSSFVNTPAFDQIAREGVYFTKAYAASPGCAPSRSSLVTGRYPWQNEQAGQHASFWPKKYGSLVDILQQAGYETGRTGKGVDPFQLARNAADSLWRSENPAGPEVARVNYADAGRPLAKGISNINYAGEFENFITTRERPQDPFFFWYGAREPHRGYEKDSWKRTNKKLADVKVPGFLPDNLEVRGDLLDYAVEVEWFDTHLNEMILYLKEINEYDHTIIIVTSDNGMPFPRTKANCYEFGIHIPLAIKFTEESHLNKKTFKYPVSLTSIAPTLLELLNIKNTILPMSAPSLIPQLENPKLKNESVYASRERHSSSRYNNWGYPQRSIVTKDYLLVWNLKPQRWPAGAPRRYAKKDSTRLLNMYSLDANGKYTQDDIFTDVDGSPSKTYLIEHHHKPEISPFFNLAFDFRPEFELFDINKDPSCLNNLKNNPAYDPIFSDLYQKLIEKLKQTKDPRMGEKDQDVFDSYPRFSEIRYFPKPNFK